MRQHEQRLRRLWRILIMAAGLFGLVVVAIVATWAVRGGVEGGLTAAARLLRHGPTDVYDFQRYPARLLRPSLSATPWPVAPDAGAGPPAALKAPDGTLQRLTPILQSTRTLAFVVVQDDEIVFEHHSPSRDAATPSQLFSVSKSVLATLLGMAIDDGLIASIDQPVTDYVPELAAHGFGHTPLRRLVDMNSGLDYTENDNPFGLHVLMNYTSRLEDLVLGFRLRNGAAGGADPAFRYTSGDTALLSLALRRALGAETLTAYAQRRLWDPLGMEDGAVWTLDREGGLEKAWCCLATSARDLARLGRLWLQDSRDLGTGRPLLSARWIAESMPRVDADGRRGYTHGWWPTAQNASDFLGTGKDGQFLYISPARNTVIVRLGETHGYPTMAGWTAVFDSLAEHDWRPGRRRMPP
jgi:CubicO group peptidase (beta-lactamase class C family)